MIPIKELQGLNNTMVALVAGYKDGLRKQGRIITWKQAREDVERMTKEEIELLREEIRKDIENGV